MTDPWLCWPVVPYKKGFLISLIKPIAAGIKTELVACGLWWSLWCSYWYSFQVRSWLTPFLYTFVQGLMYGSSLQHHTVSVICNLAKDNQSLDVSLFDLTNTHAEVWWSAPKVKTLEENKKIILMMLQILYTLHWNLRHKMVYFLLW